MLCEGGFTEQMMVWRISYKVQRFTYRYGRKMMSMNKWVSSTIISVTTHVWWWSAQFLYYGAVILCFEFCVFHAMLPRTPSQRVTSWYTCNDDFPHTPSLSISIYNVYFNIHRHPWAVTLILIYVFITFTEAKMIRCCFSKYLISYHSHISYIILTIFIVTNY